MKANVAQEILHFNDDNETYKIEPQSGKIWPKTKALISVSFSPKMACEIPIEAFCNVTCSAQRLRLQLFGTGLGPEAKIIPQNWCLNDVSVNEEQSQKIKILNQGEIPFRFSIKPNNTAFGKLFEFSETEGYLETTHPKKEKTIEVKFISSKVGDFSERFEIQLGKDVNPLIFSCEGKVIAPPMKFEEQELDFSSVPYGFEDIKEATLINMSNVEIPFEIEIPDEEEKKNFQPDDPPKSIKPKEKAKIRVKFHPVKEGSFPASLTVKVPNVAQDFATLPLKGVCERPTVEISPTETLDYGQIFLRHPKVKTITLTNTSNLKARYQFDPQEEGSKRLAQYYINNPAGEIPRKETCEIEIKLEAEMRGQITVPLTIDISSRPIREKVIIKAEVLGPQVNVDSQLKEFKEVKVLSKVKDKVTIHNTSEIPATFTAFTKEKNSIFSVEPRTDVLQPEEKKELTITCCPDDPMIFEDTLYINITDGCHSEVKLRAKALGTSICLPNYESTMDENSTQKLPVYKVTFGINYINSEVVKPLSVENRGRHNQRIRVERYPPVKANKQKKEKEQKDITLSRLTDETKKQKEDEDEEAKHVFTIDQPEEEKGVRGVDLEPMHGFTLNCRAKSKNIQKDLVEEYRFLAGTEGTRKEEPIFIVKFCGSFILPDIIFSVPKLFFKYIWEGALKSEPIVKDLEISCECIDKSKGASFKVNVPYPFRAKGAIEKLSLMPGGKQTIQVEFDPTGVEGRESKKVGGFIDFVYEKDKGGSGKPNYRLPLEAELCYPNLEVYPKSIDFKCILFDTSKKDYLTLKNSGGLPVKYHWEFVDQVSDVIVEVPEEDNKKRHKKQQAQVNIPVNEIFDILPISGILQSGEVETVEVTFHATVKNPPPGFARCVVEGGPEYVVKFKGEGDEISEQILEENLDLGYLAYNEEGKGSFKIKNNGKVSFKFFISLEKTHRPEIFHIEPQSGLVSPDDPVKIEVKLKPCIPDNISEKLLIYVAHKQPYERVVTAIGTFPFLLFATQRFNKEEFGKKIEETQASLEKYSQCLQPREEIQKILAKKGEQSSRSQMSSMLKPQIAEIEAEVDKRELCKTLSNVPLHY